MLSRLDGLDLLPVLEFDPAEYRDPDREPPGVNTDADAAAYQRYWYDSLADAGIVGLNSLNESSYVSIRDVIEATTLARLAATRIDRPYARPRIGEFVELDHLGPLGGGYVLRSWGKIKAWPGCCSDLGNLSSWESARAYRGESWEMVWIGHPWISVRFDEGRLILSEPHESDEPVAQFSIDPKALALAIDSARVAIEQFEDRLVPVIEGLVPSSQVQDIVRILTRGH
jgi:hypothetical protein